MNPADVVAQARALEIEARRLRELLLEELKENLWARVNDLSREEMQLLRDMLNEKIKATYDSDDD